LVRQYAARFFLPFIEAATHVQSVRFVQAVSVFTVLQAGIFAPFFGAAETLLIARPAASSPTAEAIVTLRRRAFISLISSQLTRCSAKRLLRAA
jgi:hypothetical protein